MYDSPFVTFVYCCVALNQGCTQELKRVVLRIKCAKILFHTPRKTALRAHFCTPLPPIGQWKIEFQILEKKVYLLIWGAPELKMHDLLCT